MTIAIREGVNPEPVCYLICLISHVVHLVIVPSLAWLLNREWETVTTRNQADRCLGTTG